MKITKSTDPQNKPPIIMLVYGQGGVGKTTFGATSPKPLLLDCENGSKYFGLRGIELDVVQIKRFDDVRDKELITLIESSNDYESIIIDPIGELMEKLIESIKNSGNKKFVQYDGSLTMSGWGEAKDRMRRFMKFLRDSGKNILLIAHIEEKMDEERMIKRPMIATKISEELVNLVDIVGFMTVVQKDNEDKRVIMVDPSSDKYTAKDRTGQLEKYIEPDFDKIVKAAQGSEEFSWTKPTNTKKNKKAKTKNDEPVKPKGKIDPKDIEAKLQKAKQK